VGYDEGIRANRWLDGWSVFETGNRWNQSRLMLFCCCTILLLLLIGNDRGWVDILLLLLLSTILYDVVSRRRGMVRCPSVAAAAVGSVVVDLLSI